MEAKEAIRKQIIGALKGASFPIEIPQALLNAFPNGAQTTCQYNDVTIKAGDAGKVLTPADFPFLSAEVVADTIVERAGL